MSHRTAAHRFVLVGLVLPAVVALAGVAVLIAVMPQLPDPVAVHWGAGGAPDGFAPGWMPPVIVLGAGLGLPLLIGLPALPGLRRGEHGWTHRFIAAVSLGLSAFVTVLIVVSTASQAQLADAAEAGPIGAAIVAATAAGAGLGVAGWFLQPAPPASPAPAESSAELAEAEPSDPWEQRITIARAGLIVLASAFAVLVAATAITVVATPPGWSWVIVIGLCLLIAALVASCLAFRVRIDEEGLSAVSALGWPGMRVPLEDVETVRVVAVSPFAEFGGWGWRWAAGRTGIVLRTGPGIEVRRRSGSAVVVTVDDAETAAATLTAFAAHV